MSEKNPFFISLTIPYVNGTPHIGHALEAVQGDAMARYQRLLGKDVFFVYGSDENSLKNVQAAETAGESIDTFIDRHAKGFAHLKDILNLSNNDFIRTTETRHMDGAKKLWAACDPEDIYKKTYRGLYCVGCEAFYEEVDLIDGKCPDHLKELEEIEEENYFFRLSRYQEKIEELLTAGITIHPNSKKNEMLAFVKRGLKDFSISRSVARAHGWGVPVPGDDSQIMYVWFDALSNYINALGYATDDAAFHQYWLQEGNTQREVVHVLGKGVARFHLVYWIGMLLSAKLPLPTDEFVHGYITVDGQKMSKSIGNVISPAELVNEYKTDPVRHYFLRAVSAYQDGDFSHDRFKELYTAELVNGVGNLTSRVLTMLEKYNDGVVPAVAENIFDTDALWERYHQKMGEYAFHDVSTTVQTLVTALDGTISNEKPWEKVKAGDDICVLLYQLAEGLRHIGLALLPLLPETGESILSRLGIDPTKLETLSVETAWGRLMPGQTIHKGEALFPRLAS